MCVCTCLYLQFACGDVPGMDAAVSSTRVEALGLGVYRQVEGVALVAPRSCGVNLLVQYYTTELKKKLEAVNFSRLQQLMFTPANGAMYIWLSY